MLKTGWRGLLLSIATGTAAYLIKVYFRSGLADPLLVAMLLGIGLNLALKEKAKLRAGLALAPLVFIPVGIIFYAARNLNFVRFSQVNPSIIILLVVIMLVYYGVILILGRLLKQKKEITYLTATGSAICGASAIAITAHSVKADSEDVSISLLSVALAASFGLFMLLPFLAVMFGMDNKLYAILSASVMQFTGFVEASIGTMPMLKATIPPDRVMGLALSVKAVRYLGLLIAIPLFTSLIRKEVSLPWFLWAFLGAGVAGSIIYARNPAFYADILTPAIEPVYTVMWATAMGAMGLNADLNQLLSDRGVKALIMAFSGFFAAVMVFLAGIAMIVS